MYKIEKSSCTDKSMILSKLLHGYTDLRRKLIYWQISISITTNTCDLDKSRNATLLLRKCSQGNFYSEYREFIEKFYSECYTILFLL